ncbi:DUF4912 domain-containing protein [Sebaldella sp. S0638]|uniref:DUF4912 domain-containing protein n=1 Tax=Sebaldella sp. S0638 TaxID=2957809 RepID=UPI00209EC7C6|nr:DUF4912 domain-containing protein [Sebaldella sp. S0638]MCP1223102.1 DUF4912 domain-containing protein [Sebaldella sp. S0638]
MKYLEDMSNEELLMIAKRERVLLSLKFLRDELINSLEVRGYAKKDPVKAAHEMEEIERERNRPKKNEIRIAADGSVEVVEIPLEEHEIEDAYEVKEEKAPKVEHSRDTQKDLEVAKEIAREIDEKMVGKNDINTAPETEKEAKSNSENGMESEKIVAASEKSVEEISVTPSEKASEIVSVKQPEVERAEVVPSERNNIRIVFLNQEVEMPAKRKNRKKFHRNFIFRRGTKKLREKTRGLYDLRSKLEFYPTSLDEDFVNRRIKERKVQNSKYLIGNERVSEASNKGDVFFDKAPLPSAYFVDEVVLMPKNNNTLFAYWEIRDDTYNKLKHEKNILSNVVIKVYKNGVEDQRIIRSERLGSHYIHNIEAAQDYDVSIGYENADGEYIEIAHSSRALAPRDKASENKDLKWLEVNENNDKKELEVGIDPETDENYIDEDVFSVLLDKLRNVRSS